MGPAFASYRTGGRDLGQIIVGSSDRAVCFLPDSRTGFVSGSLIKVGKSISEPVSKIRGAPILFLENRVFDDSRPGGAMLLITSFQGSILCFGEGSSTFTSCLLEQRSSVWESGSNFVGKMSLGIGVMLFVSIREISSESS